MKTNMTLAVNLGEHQLQVEHLTKIGSLNELVKIGNDYRKSIGKKPMRMDVIVKSVWFKEFVEQIEKELKESNPTKSGIIPKSMITRKGNTRKRGTWVHLKIMLRVAIEMNPEFASQVIETFINGKLLEHRDLAGDNFNILTASVSKFEDVNYQRLARAMNYIVFDKHEKGIRQTATKEQLKELHELEQQLNFIVKNELVNDFSALMNVMRKLYNQKYVKF